MIRCQPLGGSSFGYKCSPTTGRLQRQFGKCYGVCEPETGNRIVMTVGSPWYGPDWHCVDCGDSWDSDYRFERPFRKGWRKEAIERHERLWEQACNCPVAYDEDYYALPCNHAPEK